VRDVLNGEEGRLMNATEQKGRIKTNANTAL
jgi:hypothetical protein